MANLYFLQKTIFFLNTFKFNSFELINDFFFIKKIYKKNFLKINIVLKFGIDPNFKTIHLGHLSIINKIFQFKKLFFKIILLIGDFTSLISLNNINYYSLKNRKKYISLNISYFLCQLNFFLKFESNIHVYYNSEWLFILNINELLTLFYIIKLNKIFFKKNLKKKLEKNTPIFLPELIYPFYQSYDSIFIKSDIEIGGLDQRINFLITRDIQKKINKNLQIIILLPLLMGLDGFFKMSKSKFNFLSFDYKFLNFFSRFFSLSKKLFFYYYKIISFKKSIHKNHILNFCKKNKLIELILNFFNKNYCYTIFRKIFFLKIFKFKIIYLFIYKLFKILNISESFNKSILFIKNKSFYLNGLIIKNYNFFLLKGFYFIRFKKNNYLFYLK